MSKRVIIVAPQFPPANLAGVHRSRLFARYLPDFGWEPIVVTVHHKYYEEALDWNLATLVPEWLRVERVAALPTKPLRTVGDIGVRGFIPMLRRILAIIDREPVDFLYITIPSFFAAPLGRIVHALRGVPYGLDYIDPWINDFPGSDKLFTKHWASRRLGDILEPIAVKNASLITGVTEGSYRDMFVRNPAVANVVVAAAMPYGGDAADHDGAAQLGIEPYVFTAGENKKRIVYAGTMWPAAYATLDRVFRAIAASPSAFENTRFYFIGTGASPRDPQPQIKPMAAQYGLSEEIIVERPARIPYLDVLVHLAAADGVFIFGSTEPHYTPSKVYQGVLSGKPILGVLHEASTACAVLRDTGAGVVLSFNGERELDRIEREFPARFAEYQEFSARFDPTRVDRARFEEYSARSIAGKLADALDAALRLTEPAALYRSDRMTAVRGA